MAFQAHTLRSTTYSTSNFTKMTLPLDLCKKIEQIADIDHEA